MSRTSQRILSRVDDVAGLPPRSSFVWGGAVSPLAFIVFHLLAVLRFLSPLQWVKLGFRTHGGARSTTNVRADFPAGYSEWYFLVVGSFALVIGAGDLA